MAGSSADGSLKCLVGSKDVELGRMIWKGCDVMEMEMEDGDNGNNDDDDDDKTRRGKVLQAAVFGGSITSSSPN